MGNNGHQWIAKEENQITQDENADKLTVFIVDKQSIFRQGLRQVLSSYRAMEVVGECDPTPDVFDLVESLSPDIALVGVGTSIGNGFGMVSQLAVRFPGLAVVVLAPEPDDDQLFQAIKSGAVAYLSKNLASDELAGILRKVGRGEYPINDSLLNRPKAAKRVLQLFHSFTLKDMGALMTPLSPREMEILKQIAEGNSNKRIANTLNIGEQTIKNHITSIMRKLNANDRTHAVVLAMRNGWLNIEEVSDQPAEEADLAAFR